MTKQEARKIIWLHLVGHLSASMIDEIVDTSAMTDADYQRIEDAYNDVISQLARKAR